MTTARWTVRSVDPAIIERVRSVQDQTGFRLGEILSLSVQYGVDAALTELTRRQPPRPINHRRMLARYARGRGLLADLIRRLRPGNRPRPSDSTPSPTG